MLPCPARVLAFVLCASLLAASPLPAGDRRPDPTRFRVLSWNVRFLFDGREPEGQATFPWKGDVPAARAHLRAVAAVLAPLDADFIHISEVEDLATLERLRVELGDDSYRAYLVPGRDTVTRQNVGFLTRVDPLEPPSRTDASYPAGDGGERQAVSKNYLARLPLGELSLVIVGVHLLAFPQDLERVARREAQAEVIRRFTLLEATARGAHLLLLGDFNDHDPEVPDVAGNTTLSATMSIVRSVDRRTAEDDLVNAATWLPRERRFTAFVDLNQNGIDDGLSERSLTDHILVAEALSGAIERVEVVSAHEPISGPSDHFPLLVSLDLARLRLFRRGDVGGDGAIDLRDARDLFEHLAGTSPLVCARAGDVDDSGAISLADVLYLVNRITGLGPEIPAPGPLLAGPDPTPALEEDGTSGCVAVVAGE